MKNIIILLKVFLKNNFLFEKFRKEGTGKGEKFRLLLVLFLLFILAAFLLYGYLAAIKAAYGLLIKFNQSTDAIISFVMLISQFLILIFGTIGIISVFYLSKDTERLIPLPIKPVEIVFARFATVLINQYIVLIPFVLSAFIYYGILIKAPLVYWLKLPIIYLLLPVIPLAIITIIVMLLMRIVNFSKHKDKLIIIGSIFLMFLVLLPNLISIRMNKEKGKQVEDNAVVRFLASRDGMVNAVSSRFPPVLWATKGFTRGFSKEGIVGFSLFCGVSVLLFFLLLYLGKLIFYKGLIGINETSVLNKKKIDFSKVNFSGSSNGLMIIFKREFREMNRTPMFLLNGVIVSLFMPFFMLLWISLNKNGGKYRGLFDLFTNNNLDALVLIVALMLFISSGINGTPSSAVSREGKNFWYSKVLPISFKTQLAGKYLHSLMVASFGFIIGIFILVFSLNVGIITVIKGAFLTVLLISISIASGLLIDLRKPILDWENHRKAMKQNPNVIASVFGTMGLLALLGFAVFKLIYSEIVDLYNLYFLLIFFLSILSLLIHLFLFKKAEKLYMRIEI